LRALVSIMPNASSATAFEFCPGVFMTTMSRSEAPFRSIVSTPAPARTIILMPEYLSYTSGVILSERTMRASGLTSSSLA